MKQQDDEELQTIHVVEDAQEVEDAEEESLSDNEDEVDTRLIPDEPFSLSRRLLQMLALSTSDSKAKNS
jgi:hypothetical protein